MPDSPTVIGRKPQLFVDNHLVQYVNFVTRTAHQLHRYEGSPILRKDKPWEILPHFRNNVSVHWDEREGLFKVWYEDMGWDYEEFLRLQRSGRGRTRDQVAAMPSLERTLDNRLLYAESADGITWVKPELDYRLVDGMRTNITLGNETDGKVHAPTIVRDSIDPDESRRYKVMYWNCHRGLDDSRIAVASSPDGRNWTIPRPNLAGAAARRPLVLRHYVPRGLSPSTRRSARGSSAPTHSSATAHDSLSTHPAEPRGSWRSSWPMPRTTWFPDTSARTPTPL